MPDTLSLPGDDPEARTPTLADWAATQRADPALTKIVQTIAAAGLPLARRLALAALPGDPAAIVGTNDSGDRQKALDLAAHDHMLTALRSCAIATLVSEEAAEPVAMTPGAPYDLAIDPIDGSGSIGIGAPLGLLFALFPAATDQRHAGSDVVAAGYVSFGHSIDMGVSLGNGVTILTFDARDETWRVAREGVQVPPTTKFIAFNASNTRNMDPRLQEYLKHTQQGADGPRGSNTNMRWIAAAVGDLHRILMQGGVFLYPSDTRPGYADGHLRLLYEAFPVAFLMAQAGGSATDGTGYILDRTPNDIHAKTPLVFGSRNEVARIADYLRGV
ncbi:fructose-1,6-bisphosphatase [Jannaschia donghaensis]|uniref:Fructose-1,6-bisphosphatase class 1 n=1 Tax=Jannaschia donghaensis TaxID=420998 RepID=A0A0M6YNN6_9RHOB|nr:class 1 fructose-bisphosphatase [Jannaschia donghaensis]CTQ50616.1 Fructose-1,6-bisphosphatase class 1 [Jannaschia donghaensis]